jgi:hypothetical protein
LEDDYEEIVIDEPPAADDASGDYETITLPDKLSPKRGNAKRRNVTSNVVNNNNETDVTMTSDNKIPFSVDRLNFTDQRNCFCSCHEKNNELEDCNQQNKSKNSTGAVKNNENSKTNSTNINNSGDQLGTLLMPLCDECENCGVKVSKYLDVV